MDGEKMTENIFENGGEFCMRGDPSHKPVEWHWFRESTSDLPVLYVDAGVLRSCSLKGLWGCLGDEESDYDLIPVPKPPQIVPWESPDDVPGGIWIRTESPGSIHTITGFSPTGVVVG